MAKYQHSRKDIVQHIESVGGGISKTIDGFSLNKDGNPNKTVEISLELLVFWEEHLRWIAENLGKVEGK